MIEWGTEGKILPERLGLRTKKVVPIIGIASIVFVCNPTTTVFSIHLCPAAWWVIGLQS